MHRRDVYVNPARHDALCTAYTETLVDEVVEVAAACGRVRQRGLEA